MRDAASTQNEMMSPTNAPVTAKREVLRKPAWAKANAATATPIAMARTTSINWHQR